jgi:bifunctional non-homologous end joining protein LigD
MLASLADAPLDDPDLLYEPKYDGIRAIAEVPAGGRRVRLWSRLGNDKTRQFPEVAEALERWAARLHAPVVLDGEIVALDDRGVPAGFQQLQGRIHLTDTAGRVDVSSRRGAEKAARRHLPVAFIAFDLLRDGTKDLRERPLTERRAALERLFRRTGSSMLRLSEQVRGDGRELHARALSEGWEGLIAKTADSPYKSGKRTPDWRKVKIVHEQEFVVGGWTEPRQTRAWFGALLLGVYEGDDLTYVGHTGTGFNEGELARVMRLLRPLETAACPFRNRPRTNERPHWVKPELVAQIKFTEWTADAKLRHPVYLGLRDDKKPREIVREEKQRLHTATVPRSEAVRPRARRQHAASVAPDKDGQHLIDQLQALEDSRRDGTLDLPGGERLPVTNLHKVFWPVQKITKGELFRYYVRVAPYILPAVADRPLVMKRFPNGVGGKPFYQHRAEAVPPGVRVETVGAAMPGASAKGAGEPRPQLVGGDLVTLLYMAQLAAISQDPWFSRVDSPQFADYVALDLDPPDGVPFARVLDVARWVHDELEALGAPAVPKTSGADGLHVYIPLPPGTPYEAGLIFCQIVATVVAQKHPQHATVERAVAARGKRVYVDYLQNIAGKTLATAYSARASQYAGVSAPLEWDEVDAGVRREDFTIRSMPARLTAAGDLWLALRKSRGADLSAVTRYADRAGSVRLKGDRSKRVRRSSGSS